MKWPCIGVPGKGLDAPPKQSCKPECAKPVLFMHQMMHMLMLGDGRLRMRTTVTLDDDLLEKAEKLTGIHERPALLREALKALIAREAATRLARLGGTDPGAVAGLRFRQVAERDPAGIDPQD